MKPEFIIPIGSIITFLILIIAYLFIKLDISGREKAERQLRELNEKFRNKG